MTFLYCCYFEMIVVSRYSYLARQTVLSSKRTGYYRIVMGNNNTPNYYSHRKFYIFGVCVWVYVCVYDVCVVGDG